MIFIGAPNREKSEKNSIFVFFLFFVLFFCFFLFCNFHGLTQQGILYSFESPTRPKVIPPLTFGEVLPIHSPYIFAKKLSFFGSKWQKMGGRAGKTKIKVYFKENHEYITHPMPSSTNAAPTPTPPKSAASELLLDAAVLRVLQLVEIGMLF
jgi:hypothetical protein